MFHVLSDAARAQDCCSCLTSAHGRLHRLLETKNLAVVLGGVSFGVLLEQERRDIAASDRIESLVREQFDAARCVEDVSNVDLLPFGLELRVSAKRAGGAAERQYACVIDPNFARLAGIRNRLLAELVVARNLVVFGAGEL